MLQPIKN